MSMLDGHRTVLFVHAHPDDEAISTGALIADLASRGVDVLLLTASRGERGEVVDGPLAHLFDTPELAEHRQNELRCAARTLGVSRSFLLGERPARAAGRADRRYRDSGMSWAAPGVPGPAADVHDDALSIAPLDEVAADIAALIHSERPTLVISYDDEGGYGHPDHVCAHRATVAACRAVNERADGGRYSDAAVDVAEIVHSPGPGVEWFDLDEHRPVVADALRCHASQLTVVDDGAGGGVRIVHSGGQSESVSSSAGLRLLPR
ncbi:PIG-L family deacetylase [Okibacterium endophyticum]